MGSSGSKGKGSSCASSSNSYSAKVRRGQSKAFRGFQSYCLSSRSGSYNSDDDYRVRALQRLGSQFENVNGHERSCTLAGQHRSGLCTCRTNNGNANSNDNTSARASISRIVLLAEALFEVLDEIHLQSVVLSSRPSASLIGSIPAPNEIVDSLPVKSYSKLQKHHNEEVALCYICLVEYEEGDRMRILPCHHEFHKTCVDKWLREIQRVCPLCRGDICRSDTTAEN